MTTYKRLGLKMRRHGETGWEVSNKNSTIFTGKGNKGTVMDECLRMSPYFTFNQGRGWELKNKGEPT